MSSYTGGYYFSKMVETKVRDSVWSHQSPGLLISSLPEINYYCVQNQCYNSFYLIHYTFMLLSQTTLLQKKTNHLVWGFNPKPSVIALQSRHYLDQINWTVVHGVVPYNIQPTGSSGRRLISAAPSGNSRHLWWSNTAWIKQLSHLGRTGLIQIVRGGKTACALQSRLSSSFPCWMFSLLNIKRCGSHR